MSFTDASSTGIMLKVSSVVALLAAR